MKTIGYKYKGDKYTFENQKLSKKQKLYYIKLFNGLSKLVEDECKKSGNNKDQRIKALEDNLYKVIQEYPELLHMKKFERRVVYETEMFTKYGYNSGETFIYQIKYLSDLVDKLCEDIEVCKMETYGNNKLFFSFIPNEPNANSQFDIERYNSNSEILLSMLKKHPELLSLQDSYGYNFAMEILSKFKSGSEWMKPFMPYVIESINNEKIATQQTNRGNNLGMFCAIHNHQELFNLAYQNSKARMQKNNEGDTMEMIANNNGLIIPPLSDKQVYDFYNESLSQKINDLCK